MPFMIGQRLLTKVGRTFSDIKVAAAQVPDRIEATARPVKAGNEKPAGVRC